MIRFQVDRLGQLVVDRRVAEALIPALIQAHRRPSDDVSGLLSQLLCAFGDVEVEDGDPGVDYQAVVTYGRQRWRVVDGIAETHVQVIGGQPVGDESHR